MAYIIRKVLDDELGWPSVISRDELERRLSDILERDEDRSASLDFDTAIEILVYGVRLERKPKQGRYHNRPAEADF
jgi:hypothetical protein